MDRQIERQSGKGHSYNPPSASQWGGGGVKKLLYNQRNMSIRSGNKKTYLFFPITVHGITFRYIVFCIFFPKVKNYLPLPASVVKPNWLLTIKCILPPTLKLGHSAKENVSATIPWKAERSSMY